MRIRTLEVENFRSIRKASIELGPGLNVLHGPNDLGKSTLAEAIRAALLVPTKSKEGKSYVEWDSSEPARVTMTFECGGKMWRVRKAFGYGFKSVLEQSDNIDTPRFREHSHGGGVEGALRELLCWGVPPPGGKGAPAKPTSYLVTALLGRQGAVQEILEASLAEDKDETGKTLVTKALGALGQDPTVARVVERLSERVDAVFTPGGKFKVSADSPLVVLQRNLQVQNERLQALRDADQKGKTIEHTVIALQGDRLHLLEERQTAEAASATAEEYATRSTRRSSLEEIIGGCRHDLDRAEGLDSDLSVLQQTLTAAEAERDRLKVEAQAAHEALELTKKRTQASSEDLVRATAALAEAGKLAEAARNQLRAELEARKSAANARLKDVEAAERAAAELSGLEREHQTATNAAAVATGRVAEAEQVLEQASLVATLEQLVERDTAAERLSAAYEEAQRREDEASNDVRLAGAALTDAVVRRDEPTDSEETAQLEVEISRLRAVESHLRIRDAADIVRELEAHDKQARDYRDSAVAKRVSASALEQEAAGRVLPTREQIASWRALEVEIAADETVPAPATPSLLVPVAVGVTAGLLVALVARLVFASSDVIATVVGLAIAIVVGGIVFIARRGPRTDPGAAERRTRLSERWATEVVPALRASGLPELSAYEGVLADVARRRSEAQNLRLEAEKDDVQAAAEARTAAPLEARKAELEGLQDAAAEGRPEATSSENFGTLAGVRLRMDACDLRLDALREGATKAADETVRVATVELRDRQTAHQALVAITASARTEAEFARNQSDPTRRDEARARLETLATLSLPAVSVESASSDLARCRNDASQASTKVAVLRGQLDTAQLKAEQLLGALGESLSSARARVDGDLCEVGEQSRALDSPPIGCGSSLVDDVAAGTRSVEQLEQQVCKQRQALEIMAEALVGAEESTTNLKTQVAAKQGELKAIDRDALKAKLDGALSDPVFQAAEVEVVDVGEASQALERVLRKLDDCDRRLNAAKGQLHLVAGHVGSERLAQQEEAVRYMREEVIERERTEKAAFRLLAEIRAAEAERASHLGRSLAGPISETFQALTGGRYGQLGLDAELKTQDIASNGAPREVSALSVGTREQLATLIRLAVAAQLQTAVLLDDQLVHSDSERLSWFRDHLLLSAREHCHQVIVFTCRPGDYLGTGAGDNSVAVVDLGAHLSR